MPEAEARHTASASLLSLAALCDSLRHLVPLGNMGELIGMPREGDVDVETSLKDLKEMRTWWSIRCALSTNEGRSWA